MSRTRSPSAPARAAAASRPGARRKPIVGAEVLRTWPDPRQQRARFEAEKHRDPKLTWDAFSNHLTHTDRSGRWERRALPGGTWRVFIRAEGFEGRWVKLTLRKGEKRTTRVVLQPTK